MSDLYRKATGAERAVSDCEFVDGVVPVEPVGTLTVNDLNRVMVDDGESVRPLPAGDYLIVPKP